MAKKDRRTPDTASPFNASRFEHPLQLGGIRTGTLDFPNPSGGRSCRVAHVDTGAGLRYVVAIDRGGDIVEASHRGINLVFLTPNDYAPPGHAYQRDAEWLASWPGGLLTTCGPQHIGHPRVEDGVPVSLHGHHSNTPAAVIAVHNPDPQRERFDFQLVMRVRDARMFGPTVEVERTVSGRLGEPVIRIVDQVINRSDRPCSHSLLYHVNPGYPLLDEGARLIYRGRAHVAAGGPRPRSRAAWQRCKLVPAAIPEHIGSSERVILVDLDADDAGIAHVGLINRRLGLGLELEYPLAELPRFANWHHYGPTGCYVTGIEPFNGTMVGGDKDPHPRARQTLDPGESRVYHLTLRLHDRRDTIAALAACDGPLEPTDA